MQIVGEKVQGYNHSEMPEAGETIADSWDLDILLPMIRSASYYFRSPQDCPFARGNWLLDIRMKDGQLLCFKFPKEMTEKRFIEFLQPLLLKMNKGP
ncbi:MAG TPA: hypothetical protein VGJ00_10465 [Rhabdochlamydiaceae bacterium]|jgi:hypothetical protein